MSILKGDIIMAKKKKKPVEELQELSEQLEERHERWNHIKTHGTTDPNWPDGLNMNLVRNHCGYYRRLIKELCENHGLQFPLIYDKPLPPRMPMDFMAKPRRLLTDPPPKSEVVSNYPIQLSLF